MCASNGVVTANACNENRIIIYSVAIHFRLTISIDPCRSYIYLYILASVPPLASISIGAEEMVCCKSYTKRLNLISTVERWAKCTHSWNAFITIFLDENYMDDKVPSIYVGMLVHMTCVRVWKRSRRERKESGNYLNNFSFRLRDSLCRFHDSMLESWVIVCASHCNWIKWQGCVDGKSSGKSFPRRRPKRSERSGGDSHLKCNL